MGRFIRERTEDATDPWRCKLVSKSKANVPIPATMREQHEWGAAKPSEKNLAEVQDWLAPGDGTDL